MRIIVTGIQRLSAAGIRVNGGKTYCLIRSSHSNSGFGSDTGLLSRTKHTIKISSPVNVASVSGEINAARQDLQFAHLQPKKDAKCEASGINETPCYGRSGRTHCKRRIYSITHLALIGVWLVCLVRQSMTKPGQLLQWVRFLFISSPISCHMLRPGAMGYPTRITTGTPPAAYT